MYHFVQSQYLYSILAGLNLLKHMWYVFSVDLGRRRSGSLKSRACISRERSPSIVDRKWANQHQSIEPGSDLFPYSNVCFIIPFVHPIRNRILFWGCTLSLRLSEVVFMFIGSIVVQCTRLVQRNRKSTNHGMRAKYGIPCFRGV